MQVIVKSTPNAFSFCPDHIVVFPVRGLWSGEHIFHFLRLIVLAIVFSRSCLFLGIISSLVSVCITETVVVGKRTALVEHGDFLQCCSQVVLWLLCPLSQSLHRPILILTEAVEDKIQKLVLGNTGCLEHFALLGLDGLGSVFLVRSVNALYCWLVCLMRLTMKLPAQPTAPAVPGLIIEDAVFLLMICSLALELSASKSC